jgi:hypothetical protein
MIQPGFVNKALHKTAAEATILHPKGAPYNGWAATVLHMYPAGQRGANMSLYFKSFIQHKEAA